uniref:Uncharacterized protein n=1 Tax=Romanomermis culicivorax TaxID=13658 RepID=A0A915HFS0_ROMCU
MLTVVIFIKIGLLLRIFDEFNRIFNIDDDDDDSDQNIISNRMRALNSILELNEESSLFFQIFM